MLSLITKLNKTKAIGLDNLPTRLLRVCADLISGSLTWIFNVFVISAIFPDDLKLSNIFPIFKATTTTTKFIYTAQIQLYSFQMRLTIKDLKNIPYN